MYERQEVDVRELTLAELDEQELIELPERELMTGATSGGSLLSINASVCVNLNASVTIGGGSKGGGCPYGY